MQHHIATPILAAAIHATLVVQMARELIDRKADIASDVAVIYALARAGFGLKAIEVLRARAVQIAAELSAFGKAS